MRNFFGTAIVYQLVVKHFAKISAQLKYMLKKSSDVDWNVEIVPTEDQKDSFEKLKKYLTSPPVFALHKSGMR